MKKKKRILRTVISTVLMCCMLVGDLGSVFATTVDNTEVISEEVENKGTEQDMQTLSEPIEAPKVDIQTEQPAESLVQEPIEEPKVEVETPVVEEEVPPTEQPPVEETPVEKPQEEQSSEEPQVEPPVGDATVEEPGAGEVAPTESDNWSLDLVFYDSSVDGGKTPLKSIDWNASRLNYSEEEQREIIVQINYKNTNVVKQYQPGSVKLVIPNFISDLDSRYLSYTSINVGANDGNHTGYEWDLINNGDINFNVDSLSFCNSILLEKGSNFEGSIQIRYSLVSKKCIPNNHFYYDNSVIDFHSCNGFSQLYCKLYEGNDLKLDTGNIIDLTYIRDYNHKWSYHKYQIDDCYGSTLSSYDGLGNNAKDFIWVKYNIQFPLGDTSSYNYPNLYASNFYFKLTLPSANCIVLNKNMDLVQVENSISFLSTKYNNSSSYVAKVICYVGYPKSEFNTQNNNLEINQNFELYADYTNDSSSEYIYQDTLGTSIDLSKYEIEYTGELYSFSKICRSAKMFSGFLTSEEFSKKDTNDVFSGNNEYSNIGRYTIKGKAIYSGTPMKVYMGDDLYYVTDSSGNFRRLNDNEYSILNIIVPKVYNANNENISNSCILSLYVRYRGSDEYVLYKDNVSDDFSIAFSENDVDSNIVGFYFKTNILKESCDFRYNTSAASVDTKFLLNGNILTDPSRKGKIINIGFFKVIDENENILSVNTEENYNQLFNGYPDILKDVKSLDMSIHKGFILRDFCEDYYENTFKGLSCYETLEMKQFISKPIQNQSLELFTGNTSLELVQEKHSGSYSLSNYGDKYSLILFPYKEHYSYYKTFGLFNLLPKGVNVTSSEEDILNSLNAELFFTPAYDYNNNKLDKFILTRMLKDNAVVSIVENWRGTGRTYISVKIDLKENPIIMFTDSSGGNNISCSFDWSISYDDLISGTVSPITESRLYGESYDQNNNKTMNNYKKDNGSSDIQETDINSNNNTSDSVVMNKDYYKIDVIFSTHQDVQTSVQTDKSNYSTGLVKASPESEYSYKLRARSGSNQVSNLVLVNNLEEGYGDNEHWKGEFLGIDTSFAENRTYRVYKPSDPRADAEGYVQERVQVKPYYSTSTTEGELYQTEEKVITDPSGQQITQRVRVLDEHGNFVKNPNWLEYSDSIDKGTVKSLAFEFLDAETGEQAILPENNLIYVEIKMKAPVEADGLTADGKAKYAYNNCFTQWNALDSMGQSVDFITGINSNTVKVTVNDRVSVQINKVWKDEENKYNTRPDTVEFIMKKDGAEVDRQTLEKGKTTVTFSGLLVDELSSYTFEEVCPSGYKTEGVIYDKVADTYTATNVLDPSSLVEINGTKTWVGDLESERPESITVNLYRNDVKIDSKVVRASDGWSYDFGKFIKNDPDGNKYVYRIEEEPVDGYITNYASAENGLNIKFNSQCKTESANYDYVAIYYKGTDDKFYRLGMWGGTALAGKVVGVPSKDFWLYWRTDSSNSNYYGFSIDSIESANVEATGTAVRLPDYAVEEISGDTYPDSAFDSYTHGNYGNGVNKMWHYTMGVDGFDIVNISNMTTIEGTKSWVGDTPEVRPDSITVNLLQDGMKIDSVSTDSSKGWKYSFRVPKWDENGREYVYTVSEEPLDGYEASYYSGNGSKITFSADSRTEGASYDYVEIYYEKDGKTYKAGKWGGTAIAGTSVTIPSKDFYLYWRTDSSSCNYYGYRVESVVGADYNDIIGTVATLPNYTVNDVQSIVELQSGHNPYLNNENKLMLYHGNPGSGSMGRYDITNTLDNIELRFNKVFNTGTEGSKMELQHDGISFTLYENTLESGYPESFPGTSDEWRKVGELSKYEVGGDIGNFRSEYYIDGLKSNKEYFLVENTDNLRVTYYANLDGGLTDSFNVSTASIEDSCYVVRTGTGIIDNIFLTVYGYSNNTEYKPLYKEDFRDFCLYYEGIVKGTKLHSFLDYISRKYPSIDLGELFYLLQPEVYEGNWVISNFLETKRISVTKKIKASDINFDNGNPTFIFEARVEDALGFSSKSSESELFNFPVLDIKHVEFTKEYVEANTDEGYVSKTVYFDRIVPLSVMAIAERVGSRYDCSSVTVDGLDVSGTMSGMGCAEVFNTPFIETNITFTNEKYENQYYSHNSIVVNEIKRNKNKTSIAPPK